MKAKNMLYSASTGGFYRIGVGAEPPDDAIEITATEHMALLDAQSIGHEIVPDKEGKPISRVREITEEDKEKAKKRKRSDDVAAIVVTTSSGRMFDGDEISQSRIARAICASDTLQEATMWVLADNTAEIVSIGELKEALRLAGEAQTALWV